MSGSLARAAQQPHRAKPHRSAAHPAQHGRLPWRPGISRLQRAVGNRGMNHLLRSGMIQAKLTVGPADDEYEREADRVADEVMRMPDPSSGAALQRAPLSIQRMCPECEEEIHRHPVITPRTAPAGIGRQCAKSDEELRCDAGASAAPTGSVDAVTDAQISGLRGGGRPLPGSARTFFEPRFGSDLAHVRIHTGAAAAQTARSINARAYTLGHDIVFAAGQYAPDTRSGRALIAHELVHTFQQSEHPGRVRRFVECLPVTMQLGSDQERCPKRTAGEIGRSGGSLMFLWDLTNPSGSLVESFAIGRSAVKPNLRSNQRWLSFVQSMVTAADTHWEILGFSDCRGPEGTNSSLRKARAQAVFEELPAAVQLRIDSVEAAPLQDCIVANTAEIGRAMNRSAFIRVTALSFEGDTVTGKRPKPIAPQAPDTTGCVTAQKEALARAFPMAKAMVRQAIGALSDRTPETVTVLKKYFGKDAVAHRYHIKQTFVGIREGLDWDPTFQCNETDSFWCDGAYASVFPIIGTRIHICPSAIARGDDFLARTIIHEAGHAFEFMLFTDVICEGGCPASLDTEDAERNPDSYGEFAGDALAQSL